MSGKGSVHGEGMYMVWGCTRWGGERSKEDEGEYTMHGERRRYMVCVG